VVGDDDLITLDEAAKLIPGANADTLKRMRRKGVLRCYRPGKAYLTTANDVRQAVKKCEVRKPSSRGAPPLPLGLTEMDLANAALDAVLNGKSSQKRR
jgi:hypothetical protein